MEINLGILLKGVLYCPKRRLQLLGEHCPGNAKVVGLNPVQSLKIFSGFFQ